MSNTGLLFNANFNSGSDITSMGFKYSGNPSSIVNIAGQRAVELKLDHYGSNTHKHRTEIQPNKLPSPDFSSGMFAKMGGEFWYGVRTYMPESWNELDRSVSIITQWHARPDAGNPPVALQTRLVNGKEHFNLIIRSDPTSDGTKGFKNIDQFDLGPIYNDIGKWTDWVWRIKWSPNGDGFLQLYKDGKLVVDFKGGTCYVDTAGPYLKVGLYKFSWSSSTDTGADSRTIYVDDVRVADSTGSYATVVSPNAASAPQAPQVPGFITGTAGDDKLSGTAGPDTIDGGAGDDFLDLTNEKSGWNIDLATGRADGGGTNVDRLISIENVIGSNFADVLMGDAGGNKLRGLQGDDVIDGRAGDDTLAGGAGSDTIYGGQGHDLIYGGLDNDVLYGGAGNDTLYGDEGNDTIFAGLGEDVIVTGSGADRIMVEGLGMGTDRVLDFAPGEDVIDLTILH
uniref:heparin lyase I family protein n=1 Tax=Azospirillum halopraeferens TaxID=34010 RepID=UPI000687FF67